MPINTLLLSPWLLISNNFWKSFSLVSKFAIPKNMAPPKLLPLILSYSWSFKILMMLTPEPTLTSKKGYYSYWVIWVIPVSLEYWKILSFWWWWIYCSPCTRASNSETFVISTSKCCRINWLYLYAPPPVMNSFFTVGKLLFMNSIISSILFEKNW